ncbi:MAG: DUF1724 domain-containing protein [Methanosarcinaceae archaeon]|nr:DUF1724 domain-containing protein [Methanosarcinaceae archaeon]
MFKWRGYIHDPEAFGWGRELFEYFKKRSVPITDVLVYDLFYFLSGPLLLRDFLIRIQA